jgi:hypothetical protein
MTEYFFFLERGKYPGILDIIENSIQEKHAASVYSQQKVRAVELIL